MQEDGDSPFSLHGVGRPRIAGVEDSGLTHWCAFGPHSGHRHLDCSVLPKWVWTQTGVGWLLYLLAPGQSTPFGTGFQLILTDSTAHPPLFTPQMFDEVCKSTAKEGFGGSTPAFRVNLTPNLEGVWAVRVDH